METWRPRLLDAIKAENDWILQQREDLQRNVKDLAHKRECCNCRLLCYASDMLELGCHHPHCFDCVADRLERLCGYFERRHPVLYDRFPLLRTVIVCSTCHTPATVVPMTMSSINRIARQDRGNRAAYELGRTQLRHKVRTYFQNQRRSLFGKFFFQSLFSFERPRHTWVEGIGTAPIDLVELEALDGRSPPSGREVEVYLEDWAYDTVDGDPLGWHYAFNWPKSDHEWTYVASATTFVRRRKMYRASIILCIDNDDAKGIPSLSKRQWPRVH